MGVGYLWKVVLGIGTSIRNCFREGNRIARGVEGRLIFIDFISSFEFCLVHILLI